MLNRKICRFLILLVITFVTGLFFEFVIFNWKSIINNKYEMLYSVNDSDVIKTKVDDIEKITIVLPESVYISELELGGTSKKDTTYTLNVSIETVFGTLQNITFVDNAYTAFNNYYTRINRKVKKIEINYNTDYLSGINSINLYNKISFCYERFFLVFSILFIFFSLIIYKNELMNNLEWFFLISVILLGTSIILIVGLKREGWDEQIHFNRVYSYSFINEIKYNEVITENEIMRYNTVNERNMVKKYYNKKYRSGKYSYVKKEFYTPYIMRGYLPETFMIFLGRHLGFSFYKLYLFGKLGNLLLYSICIFISIKIAKKGKLLITILSLMPTPLFLASSYTYDICLIAMVVLAITLWMNEMIEYDKKLKPISLIMIVLLFIYGCSSKAVYIPLMLLILLFPKSKFNSLREMYFIKVSIVILFLLVMSTFIMPVTSNTFAGNVTYGGDSRGGDTGTVRQMKTILNSPFSYFWLFFKSIINMDNFGIYGNDQGLISSLEYFTFSNLGVLSDKFVYLLYPMIICSSFVTAYDYDNFVLTIKNKICVAIILLMVIGMIWSALYLDFTEIGMEHIYGVQARYYIPITIPFLYIFNNNKIKINIPYEKMKIVFMYITILIISYGVYFKLFLNVFQN